MSRYRVTERELLEQVRAKSQFSTQEGRMKDIYTMAFDGDSAESIAKKLKLDVATVKKVVESRVPAAETVVILFTLKPAPAPWTKPANAVYVKFGMSNSYVNDLPTIHWLPS